MHLVLHLIGIILVACVGSSNDPCNEKPYTLQAYLPFGTFSDYPCKKKDAVPTPHAAYIRVHQHVQNDTNWPGVRSCNSGDDCFLYPLIAHDAIYIEGVSDGKDGMSEPFDRNTTVAWGNPKIEPGVKLSPKAAELAFATLAIRSGIVIDEADEPSQEIYATGNFDLPTPVIRIIAEGTNRQIVIRGNAHIDIVNLPPAVAQSANIFAPMKHPHPEHFFLHYTLAADKPEECHAPEPKVASKGHAAGSIFCSNSNYP